MKQAKRRFIRTALLAVGALLAVLLAAINVTGFTMAANDADRVLERLSGNHGIFGREEDARGRFSPEKEGMGPMGPGSPETEKSVRYFTVAFDTDGKAETVAFEMTAVTESDAQTWARSLLSGDHGWTKGTYRYRVYRFADRTYVTVIDQGRELTLAYRILTISAIGFLAAMLLSFLVLRLAADKFLGPVEDADRKQKQFIARAKRDLKEPVDAIAASNGNLERALGENEDTKNIARQVKKLGTLAGRLGALTLFDEEDLTRSETDLSALVLKNADRAREKYAARPVAFETDVPAGIVLNADEAVLDKALWELADNTLKFAVSRAKIGLQASEGRVTVVCENDTTLKPGSYEAAFDRFVRLSNADALPGVGLGLPLVRDAAAAHNGRVKAEVKDGLFTVTLTL
ncbi:MAG: HAMP domain-containing histidine kinase [Clostridia bacterium]|nr:HAMP domain-containing histidine kinase [Clostridia bacterium]